MKAFEQKWAQYEQEFLQDLQKLVAIPSVRDMETANEQAPFGKQIRCAFDCFLEIAKKCGLEVQDTQGYACDARLGQGEYIGVLGHLDVVPAGQVELWNSPPYTLTVKGDMLYGRGVNDDKAPLLTCLYIVRIIKELNIPCKLAIRVIAGGAEETTWECMKKYFAHNPQPIMGFSPDGNFPIVNGEKGIRKYDICFPRGVVQQGMPYLQEVVCDTLRNYVCDRVQVKVSERVQTFEGVRALSRNPQRGKNALLAMAEHFKNTHFAQSEVQNCFIFLAECFLSDTDGTGCGIVAFDEKMGNTSICPTGMEWKEDGLHLYVDIRYPKTTNPQKLDRQWTKLSEKYHFSFLVEEEKKLLYVDQDHLLIQILGQAYEQVTGQKAECFTKGGASYARTLDCGIAFGATFPEEQTNPHMPNECMSLHTIRQSAKIYYQALIKLTNCHNNGESSGNFS